MSKQGFSLAKVKTSQVNTAIIPGIMARISPSETTFLHNELETLKADALINRQRWELTRVDLKLCTLTVPSGEEHYWIENHGSCCIDPAKPQRDWPLAHILLAKIEQVFEGVGPPGSDSSFSRYNAAVPE
jgi:hypothetical protein